MKSEVLETLRKLQALEIEPIPDAYDDHWINIRKINMCQAEKEFAKALKEALDWEP